MEDAKAEQELLKKAKAGKLVEIPEKAAPAKGENFRTFNVFVDDEYFEVGVDPGEGAPVINYVQPMPGAAPAAFAPAAPRPPPRPRQNRPRRLKPTRPKLPRLRLPLSKAPLSLRCPA